MHHPILFGLFIGFIVTRILFRRRMFARYGFAGGCGPGFGRHAFMRHGFRGGWAGGPGWQRDGFGRGFGPRGFWGGEGARTEAPPVVVDAQRLDRALADLELNERQKVEVDESLSRLRDSLAGNLGGWEKLPAIFSVVAAPAFDAARAEATVTHATGALRKEIVDGLEHFHNVLTAEQRDKLARHAQS